MYLVVYGRTVRPNVGNDRGHFPCFFMEQFFRLIGNDMSVTSTIAKWSRMLRGIYLRCLLGKRTVEGYFRCRDTQADPHRKAGKQPRQVIEATSSLGEEQRE